MADHRDFTNGNRKTTNFITLLNENPANLRKEHELRSHEEHESWQHPGVAKASNDKVMEIYLRC
jgi:hypothetical protein